MRARESTLRRSRLRLSSSEWRVFAIALGCGLLAKGAAFLPLYAIDDYRYLVSSPLFDRMLADGRFGQAAVMGLFSALGFESIHANVLSTAVGLCGYALLGVSLVRHWGLPVRRWTAAAVACLIGVHPYSSEIFTFRTALATYSLSLVLLAVLLLRRRWGGTAVIAGALVFAFALSIYQSVLHYAVMAWLMAMAIRLGRQHGSRRWRPRLRNRHDGFAIVMAIGIPVYAVTSILVRYGSGLRGSPRTHPLSLAELGARLRQAGDTLIYRFWQADPLIARPVKLLLLALLVWAVAAVLWRARPWRRRRVAAALTACGLLACGAAWTLGLNWVLSVFWPVPRTLSHVALLWAAALALATVGAGAVARRLAATLAGLVLLGFVGMDNRILSEQQRINARDAATASRIVARLETLPGIEKASRLVFVGLRDGYPLAVRTHDMDLNLSAFAARWSQIPLLVELSGRRLPGHPWLPDDPGAQARAQARCSGVAPWPSPQSVAVEGDLATVCLPPAD